MPSKVLERTELKWRSPPGWNYGIPGSGNGVNLRNLAPAEARNHRVGEASEAEIERSTPMSAVSPP